MIACGAIAGRGQPIALTYQPCVAVQTVSVTNEETSAAHADVFISGGTPRKNSVWS